MSDLTAELSECSYCNEARRGAPQLFGCLKHFPWVDGVAPTKTRDSRTLYVKCSNCKGERLTESKHGWAISRCSVCVATGYVLAFPTEETDG